MTTCPKCGSEAVRSHGSYVFFRCESFSFQDKLVESATCASIQRAVRAAHARGIRDGLTKAAEICDGEKVSAEETRCEGDLAYNTALKHAHEAILAHRDNLQ